MVELVKYMLSFLARYWQFFRQRMNREINDDENDDNCFVGVYRECAWDCVFFEPPYNVILKSYEFMSRNFHSCFLLTRFKCDLVIICAKARASIYTLNSRLNSRLNLSFCKALGKCRLMKFGFLLETIVEILSNNKNYLEIWRLSMISPRFRRVYAKKSRRIYVTIAITIEEQRWCEKILTQEKAFN